MAVFGNTYRSYGELSYGDTNTPLGALGVYNFPPTYSLSFNAKPVMSENGISAKYIRNELTINWVVPYEYIALIRPNPNNDPYFGNGPASVDTAVQQIKAILMKPRGELRCTFQGLGGTGNITYASAGGNIYGFVINRGNDLNHGPVPIDFKSKNIAQHRCVELTWSVACHTPSKITFNSLNEVTSETNITAISEMSWSRSFDINEDGLPTITTTGVLEQIPQSLAHIETQRVRFAFPVPLYCQRISQRIQFESNTNRITFTLVDKAHNFENALPNGAIKMDLNHDISSSLNGSALQGKGFLTWANVISGSITLPSGEPPITAALMFWFYVRQRMMRTASTVRNEAGAITQVAGVAGDQAVTSTDEKGAVKTHAVRNIVTKISHKESLFSRTHNFRVEYVGTYSLHMLFEQSGLFTPLYNYKQQGGNPVPWNTFGNLSTFAEPWSSAFDRSASKGSNTLVSQWLAYKNQFNGNPSWNPLGGNWSIYGYLGHTNNTNQAMVWIPEDPVSPYSNNSLVNEISANAIPAWNQGSLDSYESNSPSPNAAASNPVTNPDQSYVDYQCEFALVEEHNTYQFVRQKCDANIANALKSNASADLLSKYTREFNVNNSMSSSPLAPSDYTSSYNGQSNMMLVMSGYAVRAGLPAPIPSVFTYNGTGVMRGGKAVYSNKQIGRGETPLYLATWSIPYYVNTMNHPNVFQNLQSNALTGVLT